MSLQEELQALEARLEAMFPVLPSAGVCISVIMPTRNRACFIGKAIESVLAQTYQDWELVIIDDGSTDDTAQAVAAYLADPRIRYSAAPARGAPAARNTGIAAAKGELIGYLDSDNEWAPRYLAAMAAAFADPEVETAYAALLREDAGAESLLFLPFDPEVLAEANFIDLNVFMHRRALFTRHGGFDERLKRMMDWDLVRRYTQSAPALAVPVLGTHYHTDAPDRISVRESFPEAYRQIRAKSRHYTRLARPPRVLAVLPEGDARAEIDFQTEQAGMRALGVEIESATPEGLAAAIAAARPDLLHAHGVAALLEALAAGLPVTARCNAPLSEAELDTLFGRPNLCKLYLPAHRAAPFTRFPDLRGWSPVFHAGRFTGGPEKFPRLVFGASASPTLDFEVFLRVAKALPEHLCVLALLGGDAAIQAVREQARSLASPAYILGNLRPEQVADWMALAGIYLHPAAPDGGQPLAIAEAMASGCRVFIPDSPALLAYAAEAGTAFAGWRDAAERIAATAAEDAAAWRRAKLRATDRGWSQFSGDGNFHMLHEDWARISAA